MRKLLAVGLMSIGLVAVTGTTAPAVPVQQVQQVPTIRTCPPQCVGGGVLKATDSSRPSGRP
jgi:hypothetical protein